MQELSIKSYDVKMVEFNRDYSTVESSISCFPDSKSHGGMSSDKEKIKMAKLIFTTILAICYAMFLVIFAAIVFIQDAVGNLHPVPQIFCIFMIAVGFFYFLFLFIDIRRQVSASKDLMFLQNERSSQVPQSENSDLHQTTIFRETSHQPPVPHNYCFVTGRHGELLYLKLGAVWFCCGLLVHSTLTLTYQIIYLLQGSSYGDPLQLTVNILFPLYSLFILFFIFKYASVVINHRISTARIMLMHAIGSTLAFWIYTIVNETVNAIRIKRFQQISDILNATNSSDPSIINLPDISITDPIFDIGADKSFQDWNQIYLNLEPYLYPFVVEFNILTVGIFYMIWANINKCPNKGVCKSEMIETGGSVSGSSTEGDNNHEVRYKSRLIIHADCHAANRGLFAGLILVIFKIAIMILLHVAVTNPDFAEIGIITDRVFELIVLIVLIIVTIIAYFQTIKLDINHHTISKLDDVLLLIAIPAFFSETIFSLVPAVIEGSILNIITIKAQLIQILIQTPWIIDALRRCANSVELRRNKPGRELVTFLTIANVALWIYYTFTVKTADVMDIRYKFYGEKLWSILNHLSLPLIMFYRFHASVCLVDVWKHGYEAAGNGH